MPVSDDENKKEELGPLSIRQINFCLMYVKTGNALEAYRRSYNVDSLKDASLKRNTYRLLKTPKIQNRIESLKAPAIAEAELSVDSHLKTLTELRDLARKSGNLTAAIRAEELRGKVAGFYIDKVEVNTEIRVIVFDDDDIEDEGEPAVAVEKKT